MQPHPLCQILPEMPDAEFQPLVADIRAKGLLRPITLFEGMILDGRHRFKACAESGVEPRFEQYNGNDPVGFVQSCCTHRSLNATQRAMVAAGFLEYEREQARKRQAATQIADGNAPVRIYSSGPEDGGRARDKAGARMGVSGTTVNIATKVIDKAVPEIIDKCKSGEMALNEAKQIVDLGTAAQRRIAAMPKKERAREIQASLARKAGCHARDYRQQVAVVPGTPFVKTMLGGLERLAMVCAEQGLKSGSDIAARFISEMEWDAQPLTTQLERCEPIIRALAIIQQQRTTKAA